MSPALSTRRHPRELPVPYTWPVWRERQPRMPLPVALGRGLRWRCPNCGRGRVFGGWIRVRSHCPVCDLAYFREPGYFLGAMILNYGVTIALLVPAYLLSLTLPDVPSLTQETKLGLWLGFAVLVSLALMRHCYSLWLALDYWIEPWETGEADR